MCVCVCVCVCVCTGTIKYSNMEVILVRKNTRSGQFVAMNTAKN